MVHLMLSGPRENCIITESGRVLTRIPANSPDPVLTAAQWINAASEAEFPEVSGPLYYYYCTYLYIFVFFISYPFSLLFV